MNTRTYFGKSLAVIAVAIFLFTLLISIAFATVTSFSLTAPTGGEYLAGTQSVTWTATADSGDTISIALSSNGGSSYSDLISGVNATDGTYSWDTTGTPDGSVYKIKVTDGVIDDVSASNFTVDNTAPIFTVNNGTDTGPVQTDTINVTVAETVPANESGIASQEYGFSGDNVCNVGDTINIAFTSGNDFDIIGDHDDYLCVKATDNAGNIGYELVGLLNTDNTAPGMIGLTGTTIQGAGDTIVVTFDEEVVVVDSMWSANELVFKKGSGGVTLSLTNANFSYSTKVLTVTLDEATDMEWLKNGADEIFVAYLVGGTIKDAADNELSGGSITQPVTGDTVEPEVAITYSNNGPVKDTDLVTITATFFNEALDTTVNDPKISIDVDGTGDVSAVTMTGSGLVWTYAWTVTDGGDGTATITIDAEDLAGNNNPVESNNTILVDNTAPSVLSYELDDATVDTFFNSNTDNAKIDITANEPVKYTRIYICEEADGVCDDGTATRYYTSILSFDAYVMKRWDGYETGGAVYAPDGEYKVKINFEDEAGNTSTETLVPYNIFVDTVSPSMAISDPTTDLVVHDVAGNVAFTFVATDTNLDTCAYKIGTGAYTDLPSCTSPQTLTLVDGRQTVTFKATDLAGNIDEDSEDFVVDTDGILTVAQTGTPDFGTIQGAIDAWVSGITEINVASGSYSENVIVDQDVTIQGNSGAVLTAPGGTALKVTVDGVTIDGMTIENPTAGYGIQATDVNDLTITNNTIQNIGTTLASGSAQGVYVKSSSVDVTNLTISNNTITNIGNLTLVAGSGTSAKGIFLGDSSPSTNNFSGVVIDGNDISNVFASTAAWSAGRGAYGILANHNAILGLQITNNIISTLEGLWAHGIGLENDTPSAVVTGNTISNLTDHKGNIDEVAIFFESNPSIATITVTNNKMSNSALGVVLHPALAATGAGVLDASMNWWGDATGPYNANSNPSGSGVAVWPAVDDGETSYVKFSPFYNSDALTDLVSTDPIDYFDLNFNPTSQAVNNPATLTVTARDALNYLVVNDTTTGVSLTGDNGSSFGSTLLTMEADGDTDTTITNTITGNVNVTALEVGGSATGSGTIEFVAGSDVTAPIITNIQVSAIGTDTVTITWDTDEASKSQVEYGTTSSYGTLTTVDANMVTSHSVDLTSLTEGTNYHFRVISLDASSNVGTSGDNTFTTTGVDNTPPVITLLGQNPLTLTVGDTYTDPGATASDDVDGDLGTVAGSGTVDTANAGTYTVTYNVSDTAGNLAVEETRTIIVVDPAVTPVIPTIVINGATIVSSYTVTEATARFLSGLQFDTTDAASVTVNGSSVTASATVTAVSDSDAITVGLHVYNVVVTSSTGDTANITVSYEVTADFDDSADLVVTGIDAVKTYATADDTYANGWSWVYHVTVPTNETDFQMKFSDFISGANSIAAAGNIRFYTVQASVNSASTTAVTILAADTYSSVITLDADLEAGTPGRQIEVIVEMKVPVLSAGGSYSGSYGVQSN